MDMLPDVFKGFGVGETTDTTILDILNEDCWRLILDYVPIKDIVRSERVSRAWQRQVLNYLAGVRNYRIEYKYHIYYGLPKKYHNFRRINLEGHVMFEEMIQKMGPFIVKMVANCTDENRLKAIAQHCTNLEALTFYRISRNLPLDHVTKCSQLKRIVFDTCNLREDYLKTMITSETLEELVIHRVDDVTGRFLNDLKTYLQVLALNGCSFLLFKNIKSAESYLIKLKRLELNNNSQEILENVHLLLDKTPDLEHLSLMCYPLYTRDEWGETSAAIGRLGRLQELHLNGNDNVTDEWLAAAARGCPGLRSVGAGHSRATGRGLRALCRARPALQRLAVAGLGVTDEDLEACARCCEGLQLLDAMACPKLTSGLLGRLARPRPRPLMLLLHPLLEKVDKTCYEGVTVRWERFPSYYLTLVDESDSDQSYDSGGHDQVDFDYGSDICEGLM